MSALAFNADVSAASEEVMWRGVLDRNQTLDGRIYYGVTSTGIYCRPSCPSRRPRRRNVVFFRSLDSAERAGFRPCKRCQPRIHVEAAQGQARAEELRLAADMQRNLLPDGIRIPAGWDFAFASRPCREIGGDYLDVFRLSGGRLVVALGDVAGKGAAAALWACSVHAGLRAQVEVRPDLSQAVAALDRYLFESTPGNRFVTLFCGVLDPASGWLTYINAGHPPALLASADGDVRRLSGGGSILGLLPGGAFEARRVRLRAGDTLLLYSDGMSEVVGSNGQELGVEGLESFLKSVGRREAAVIGAGMERLIETCSAQAEPEDDRSWLVLRRTLEA